MRTEPGGTPRPADDPDDDAELRNAYAAAWDEWVATGDGDAWDAAVGDGLAPTRPITP